MRVLAGGFSSVFANNEKPISTLSFGGSLPKRSLIQRNEQFYDWDEIFKESARNIITSGRKGLPESVDLFHISQQNQKLVFIEFKDKYASGEMSQVRKKALYAITGLYKIIKDKRWSISKGYYSEYKKEFYLVYGLRQRPGRPRNSIINQEQVEISALRKDQDLATLRGYLFDTVSVISPNDLESRFQNILG